MAVKYILGSLAVVIFFVLYNSYTQLAAIPSPTSNENLLALQQSLGNRRYKILSLGGSTTWGTMLQHPTHSYPYILGSPSNKVTNDGFHATGLFTGSSYPSLCIERIVGRKKFDVILLEFSLDGHDGLELLLKRLRLRYPQATIVYVHLYSLLTDIVDDQGRTPEEAADTDASKDYRWGYGERISKAVYTDLNLLLKKYGGFMYSLPRMEDVVDSMYLFSEDWHHLSQEGHNTVAEGVLSILKDVSSGAAPAAIRPEFAWDDSFGTLDNKDQCEVWFSDGRNPFQFKGIAQMAQFGTVLGSEEYAIEFKGPGSIYIENRLPIAVPLYMFYMTKAEEYPFVEVASGEDHKDVKIIDPIIQSSRDIMKSEKIGFAEPGRNEIMIKPVTETTSPFRVTGFALCEACLQMQ
jgi:CheY-like chemotaxis protein